MAVVAAAVSFAFISAAGAQTVILDRLIAMVAGHPITLSDVRAARAFGLVDNGTDRARIVERLIDRELMRMEVERFAVGEPPDAAVETRLQSVRARFPSDQAFTQAMAVSGLSLAQLHAIVRDDLRIAAYLERRFAAAAQPTEDEVMAFYRQRQPESPAPPPSEALDEARRELAGQRRRELVEEWAAGLRRRAEITRVAAP